MARKRKTIIEKLHKKLEKAEKKKYGLAIISLKGKSSEAIAKEAKNFFEEVKLFPLKDVKFEVNEDISIIHGKEDLKKFDAVYLRGSYRYIDLLTSMALALRGKSYTPITPEAFPIAHNKFLTEVKLKEVNIPLPRTYFVYKSKNAKALSNKLHYPVVFKTLTGTHGKGVMFADSEEATNSAIDMLSKLKEKEPYLIQEYVETDATDIRALVVGKRVFAMERKAGKGERRAGVHSGGEGKAIELDYDTKQLVLRTAKAIGAEVCAVDLLSGHKTVVTEVNLSPGLQGISKATGKNIARSIARLLFKRTDALKSGNKKKKEIKPSREIITNLDIRGGWLRFPPAVTHITEFSADEEASLVAEKGKLVVKKVKSD